MTIGICWTHSKRDCQECIDNAAPFVRDCDDRDGWITEIHLRQSAGISHEVAYTNALDAAQKLMADGYDVTLRPTLPGTKGKRAGDWDGDEPFGSADSPDEMVVGVACGNCGGNIYMATCNSFTGSGHDWAIVSICQVCRMTVWIEGGCPDCKGADDA